MTMTTTSPTRAAGVPGPNADQADADADADAPTEFPGVRQAARTVGTLAVLSAALPLNLSLTGLALLTRRLRAGRAPLAFPEPDAAAGIV
jgi:hypothetical protein